MAIESGLCSRRECSILHGRNSSILFYLPVGSELIANPDEMYFRHPSLAQAFIIDPKILRKLILSLIMCNIDDIERPLSSIATCFTNPELFYELLLANLNLDCDPSQNHLGKIYEELRKIEESYGIPKVVDGDGKFLLIRTSSTAGPGNPMFRLNIETTEIDLWENGRWKPRGGSELVQVLTSKQINGIFLHVGRPSQENNHARIMFDLSLATSEFFKYEGRYLTDAQEKKQVALLTAKPRDPNSDIDSIVRIINAIDTTNGAQARLIDEGLPTSYRTAEEISSFIHNNSAIIEIIKGLLAHGFIGGCIEIRIYPNGHISVMDIDYDPQNTAPETFNVQSCVQPLFPDNNINFSKI